MKNTVKRIVIALLAALLLFGTVSCGGKVSSPADAGDSPVCEIVVKDFGTITVTLNRSAAPITVEHFLKLALDGSYDGSVFTRMQANFVLQGGDEAKDDSTIKGEFSANGVQNPLKHTKGVISMARSQKMDSASSQFFIMLVDYPSLDGQYAAFGEVTDGWDVVEKICASVSSSDYSNDANGRLMGFLKPEKYITIETVKVLPAAQN